MIKDYLSRSSVRCTDPDELQFCDKVGEREYLYFQINRRAVESDGFGDLLNKLLGYPDLLRGLNDHPMLKQKYWYSALIDIDDIDESETKRLLDMYGFEELRDDEREMMIAECYFETNLMDFTNE